MNGRWFSCRQQFGDGGIELGHGEELPVAQSGQDPAFDDLHADFDLGLVLRLSGAGRQNHGAVMVGKLDGGAVEFGFVAIGHA